MRLFGGCLPRWILWFHTSTFDKEGLEISFDLTVISTWLDWWSKRKGTSLTTASVVQIPKYGQIRIQSELFHAPSRCPLTFPSCCFIKLLKCCVRHFVASYRKHPRNEVKNILGGGPESVERNGSSSKLIISACFTLICNLQIKPLFRLGESSLQVENKKTGKKRGKRILKTV
mgnify:CR=1 FL=1